MKKLSLIIPLAAALLLSGCYEASSSLEIRGENLGDASVFLRNNVMAEREAFIEFTGMDPFEELTREEAEALGADTRPVDLATMRLDPFVLCDDGPKLGFNYYTGDTTNKEDMSWGRGAWYEFRTKPGESTLCKAQTGAIRVTNDGEYLIVEGAVAAPDVRNYRENLGIKISWPDGWALEETNGFQSYESNLVKWSASGGNRIELIARFRPLGPGELPIERTISGLVVDDITNPDLIPQGPEQPAFVEGVEDALESVGDQEIPEGYALVVNADGSVNLIEESATSTPEGASPSFLVYAAWGLLGAGVVSLLLVVGMTLGRVAAKR